MPTEKPFADLFATVLNDATHAAESLREDIDGFVKTRLERLLGDMNLVSREEFEAVKTLAAEARRDLDLQEQHNRRLETRLRILESRLSYPRPVHKTVKK